LEQAAQVQQLVATQVAQMELKEDHQYSAAYPPWAGVRALLMLQIAEGMGGLVEVQHLLKQELAKAFIQDLHI